MEVPTRVFLTQVITAVSFYKTIPPAMKKWPYKRGGLSWGDFLVVFHFLGASEIWPVKSGDLRLLLFNIIHDNDEFSNNEPYM